MGDAQNRANYSASIKRIYEWSKNAEFPNQTIESIQVRAKRLASVWKDFSDENSKVNKNMQNMSADDIELSEKLFEQTENWFMDADAALLARINEISKANEAATPAAVGASSSNGNANESFRENITVTIPNYTRTGLRMNPEKLPDFYGDYAQWPKFRDLFIRLVHDIPKEEMMPLAKFNALDQHLKGEAAALIAGITRSDENYSVAWSTVFDTYNKPNLIVNALIESMYSLKAVKDENPASLRFITSKYKAVVLQLEASEIDVATWDPILMYNLVDLLDPITRRDWELKNATNSKSSLNDMLKFLDERITGLLNVNRMGSRRLQSVVVRPQQQQQHQNHYRSRSTAPTVGHALVSNKYDRRKSTGNVAAEMTCPVCKGDHLVPDCEKFINLACFPRMMRARDLKLCYGCLGNSHQLSQCLTPICTHCPGKKHHPLICFKQYDIDRGYAPTVAIVNEINAEGEIVLATAMVNVQSACGQMILARALCDSGAQANLITEDFVRRLRIHRSGSSSSVQAIGGANEMAVRGTVKLTLCATSPANEQHSFTISALVMGRISSLLPSSRIDIGKWPAEVMDNLADSTLQEPGRIDLLLGAHVWSQILREKIHRSQSNGLVAQDSRLGWLVLGAAVSPVPRMHLVATLQVNELSQLNDTIQRLWELEKVPEKRHRSAEEEFCAEVFERETFRDATGRYVVSIPIDPEASLLGDSRPKALQRWYQNESRFARDPNYHREYVNFMNDYIERGHMTLVEDTFEQGEEHYFIPHHGVFSAKKFRVVFDGSAATSSGQSFNDIQKKGERLQDNLADIMLRFRLFKIALTADVQQMYRQVLVNENQRNYQLIFYRASPLEKIKIFRLNTITYGLKHAPHSAVSALQQCARDYAESHPVASESALHDYFMDDLSTGDDTDDDVTKLYRQMKSMMNLGWFPLRKWASNSWHVLSSLDKDDMPKTEPIEFNVDDIRSVLGTYWNPMSDEFLFTVGDLNMDNGVTKRIATSEVAKLFDPTGLLAAVIARGKLIIRQLWLQKVDWDQKLKEPMLSVWKNFFTSLHRLSEIRVPRWIGAFKSTEIELCGFADASEAMYAAVVYYRVPVNDSFQCGILAAKTRVAPLKKISIPRLELCGALLLSQLISSIKKALYNRQVKCEFWSDSTIALSWIKESPHVLKTFVANRVTEIQENTPKDNWLHVRSQDNPADMASRGIDANDLVGNELWWRGPSWLSLPKSEWPGSQSSLHLTDTEREQMLLERVPPVIALLKIESFWIADRYSSFTQLCLVTAFVKRVFSYNAPNGTVARGSAKPKRKLASIEQVKPLTREEVLSAERFWLRKMQSFDFPTEIKACQKGENLHRLSKLFGLSPFIDEHGILRVGGRLSNAPIPYATKFPIIIDGRSKLSKLIIRKAHLEMLHGGAQLTTRTLREKYWIVGGRNAIRSVIHECVRCVTMRGQTCTQQMADLVPERVSDIEPFAVVSLDYCGPFEVKRYPGRCNTKVKVWVAVFICMVSRAIHLELVLDLTSDAFIDAYQRFAARRGYSAVLISDNAKTFVGAKRQMLEIEDVFRKSSHSSYFTSRGIEWKFIMPRSPSQGGSHEVAVKLFKYHLRRAIGSYTLSGFELNSLMIRIEGCLNSRPLAVQSDDPNDHVVITPAQLVTNRRSLTTVPIVAVPVEPLFDEEPVTNHHLRKIQYYHQDIWRQWQSDYINSLQCRGRWQNKQPNLAIDDIVLVKEDNLAPQHWLMGKIVEVHPGKNDDVRNVTIRCNNGSTLKRAVQKLCKLPVAQDVPASPESPK